MADISIRREPFELLRRGRLFDWLADNDWRLPMERLWEEAVPLDISRKDNAVIVRASMPGFEAKDIDVQIKDGVLLIRAEHKEEKEEKEEHFYRRERHSGLCSRRVELPEAVAEDQVTAEFKNGVLTLTAPVAEKEQAQRIEIQES